MCSHSWQLQDGTHWALLSFVTPCLIGHLSDVTPSTDGAKCLSARKLYQYTVCTSINKINIWSIPGPHVKVRKHLHCGGGFGDSEGQKLICLLGWPFFQENSGWD